MKSCHYKYRILSGRAQVRQLNDELGSHCDRDYAVLYLGHCILSYVQRTISIASVSCLQKLYRQ